MTNGSFTVEQVCEHPQLSWRTRSRHTRRVLPAIHLYSCRVYTCTIRKQGIFVEATVGRREAKKERKHHRIASVAVRVRNRSKTTTATSLSTSSSAFSFRYTRACESRPVVKIAHSEWRDWLISRSEGTAFEGRENTGKTNTQRFYDAPSSSSSAASGPQDSVWKSPPLGVRPSPP
jgi:hypothetical protein